MQSPLRRSGLSWLALLAFSLVGSAVRADGAASDAPKAVDEVGDRGVVKLLDSGRAPLRRLRLSVDEGAKEISVLEIDMGIAAETGGARQPRQVLPRQRITTEIEVLDVSEQGDVTYSFRYAKCEVPEIPGVLPAAQAAVSAGLRQVQGATGKVVVDRRGRAKSVEFRPPEGIDPKLAQLVESMKQSVESLTSPFPEEAVGVGARWEHRFTVRSRSMAVRQVTTYELIELTASGGTLEVAVRQEADPQDLEAPLPGAKMRLLELDARGSGRVVFDVTSLAPRSLRSRLESASRMTMDFGGATQEVATTTDVRVRIAPPKPSDAASGTDGGASSAGQGG